jgi:hypothetical protein
LKLPLLLHLLSLSQHVSGEIEGFTRHHRF